MEPIGASGIRIEHRDEALARLPLPPTETWTGGSWNADVLTLPQVRLSLFAPRGTAFEATYDQDELYLVTSGSAILTSGEESFAIDVGDAIHVPAFTAHRFTRLTDDLSAWMVWLPVQDDDVREVASRFMRGWTTHDLDALESTIADGCMYVDSTSRIFAGRPAVISGLLQLPVPDPAVARIELGDPQVIGDRVVVEWTVFRTDGSLVAHGVQLLTIEDEHVRRCDSFRKLLAGWSWPPWVDGPPWEQGPPSAEGPPRQGEVGPVSPD